VSAEIRAKLYPPDTSVPGAAPDSDDESELRPSRKAGGVVSKKVRKARLVRHEEEQVRLKEKRQQDQAKQIARLPAVLSSIKKEAKTHASEQARIAGLRETQPDHRARTSKHEFVAEFPEVPLEDELTDRSLRTIRPALNIVGDQFKSFQEKNMIDVRKQVKGLKRYAHTHAHTHTPEHICSPMIHTYTHELSHFSCALLSSCACLFVSHEELAAVHIAFFV
jgi:hypothetical protein